MPQVTVLHWSIILYIHSFISFQWLIGWLVCCLLAGPNFWKRILLKYSIIMVFTCPLLSWSKISSHFRENNNVIVFPFPFHISMSLAKLRFISLQGSFPILKPISAHLTSEKAHFLPLEDVVRYFPLLKMTPEYISHTSLLLFFREIFQWILHKFQEF